MHILELDYPISAYDHFSESLRGEDIDFERLVVHCHSDAVKVAKRQMEESQRSMLQF